MALSAAKAWTWRISNIPAGTTEEQLIQFFVPNDRDRIKVGSLCPDVEGSSELTATVLFRPLLHTTDNDAPRLDNDTPDDIEIDRDFEGFTPLFCPHPGTLVSADIIAITGLAGHAYGSWEHAPGKMWLRDYIKTSTGTCRVLTYGYNSRVMGGEPLPGTILAELADFFLENLINMRDAAKCDQRPIIFIGHSLGCLIIKKAMTAARFSRDVDSSRLPVRAIIFLAAPHRGMEIEALRALVKDEPPKQLVDELHPRSPTLVELNERFMHVALDIEILTCFETRKTKQVVYDDVLEKWTRAGPEIMMLDPNSAKQFWPKERLIPANADHSTIAKLKKGQGSLYSSVKAAIGRAIVPTAQISRERQVGEGSTTMAVRQAREWLPAQSPDQIAQSPPAYGFPQESTDSLSPRLTTSPGNEESASCPLSLIGDSRSQDAVLSSDNRGNAPTPNAEITQHPSSAVDNTPDHDLAGQAPVQDAVSPPSAHQLVLTPIGQGASTASADELSTEQFADPASQTSVSAAASGTVVSEQLEVEIQHSWTGECFLCKQPIQAEDTFYGCILCPLEKIICEKELQSSRSCSHYLLDLPMTRRRLEWYGDQPTSIEWIDPEPTEEDSILIRALKMENVDHLNLLLQDQQLSETVDHAKRTPLHVAVMLNLQVGARLCLKHGADLKARDWLGLTPLGQAVITNNEAMARDILEHGADPNSTEAKNYTALGVAAYKGFVAISKILLSLGADIHRADGGARTPLALASACGEFDTCRLLIAEHAHLELKSGPYKRTCLGTAAYFGRTRVAKLLIDHGANLEAENGLGNTPLHSASLKGDLNTVKLLIASGANLEAMGVEGYTPLVCAAFGGRLDVVTYLLTEAGACASPRGSLPLGTWRFFSFDSEVSPETKKEILRVLKRHKKG